VSTSNMPRLTLRAMRAVVRFLAWRVRRWEDKYADVCEDYRVARVSTGLWQASKELGNLLTGFVEPAYEAPHAVSPATWNPVTKLTPSYVDELLESGRAPVRSD
jgi:ribosomal protein L37AE/L43A